MHENLLPENEWQHPVFLRKNGFFTRIGCFLTGYNCKLLRQCSEASYKKLKKYVSGMIIAMIIWFAVGFLLSREYFHASLLQAVFMGGLFAILVWHVERIIILSLGKNPVNMIIRPLLGLVMAVVGATIIDQVIFAEDIEREKIFTVQSEVKQLLPARTHEIRREIARLDSAITAKEAEREALIKELERRPVISVPTVQVVRDSAGNIIRRSVTVHKRENPKFEMYEGLEKQLETLKKRRDSLSTELFRLREQLEKELRERKGFLDDLKIMKNILVKNKAALIVWGFWFALLLIFELLVVTTKMFDSETDYEYLVLKMNERAKR
ncbi:MAG: DUF4407 domain-containing protein [Chlorobi bacterium]|nr:DUF4407 domain-containing protein [Chlorobiota bacterium]